DAASSDGSTNGHAPAATPAPGDHVQTIVATPAANGSNGNGSNPFGQVQLGEPTLDLRSRPTGIVLECRGVTKRFGGIVAVDSLDLQGEAGGSVRLLRHNRDAQH